MQPIRVLVRGAHGRMGREVVKAVMAEPDLRLVGAIDRVGVGEDAGRVAGTREAGVAIRPPEELEAVLEATDPEVAVDFTKGPEALELFRAAVPRNTSPVVGTTGMADEALAEARALCEQHSVGALIAPNFAIGAVLMMKFAQEAAKYLGDVEIIELHHERKMDAPSGTAKRTAQLIAEARTAQRAERPATLDEAPGARGTEQHGVPIHSVRLPGLVAHQEVLFGGVGQMLTIRHDSIDRTSFMPGVVLAIRRIRGHKGLLVGLENLL
ncbi:MAG TPA: 4-hydroxy-tetrahydrodipicolinate reductase [Armatimonadota bacterium]|nr:4-hydroxy-tetrahydrodipicolinate reductase [Armatimonadota bacterium]HOJ21024.1 4-hydroxy-tetrahydrodipicolinate reductase [Armatimonadota bacterium]HOM80313.1 4-hydroxy-tetrahydrodipicolinate reductase [Armatimonadota bacterium]HOQ27952.1 4-hydroxy-tetrahydrodipicolinate reductase [Armatimonadota bacterium]HPO71314.1 4-hydroxy-tetrahydrodipicolinate reductase [Armatimonadota bacterium]